MISTVQVGKNWNSHGANLGACMCQIAALLSTLDSANEGELIAVDFLVLITQGTMQTGHKHGHHDVCYVEYMTAEKIRLVTTGGEENYLNHGTFKKDRHAEKVKAIMDRTLQGLSAPMPRPTRSHTFDFNCGYGGARLVDGECKGAATEADKAILVLHLLEQLALKDSGVAMLTTNNGFTLFKWRLSLGDESKTVETFYESSYRYELGPVSDITTDKGSEHYVLKKNHQRLIQVMMMAL